MTLFLQDLHTRKCLFFVNQSTSKNSDDVPHKTGKVLPSYKQIECPDYPKFPFIGGILTRQGGFSLILMERCFD
jgi:hypothetical protein